MQYIFCWDYLEEKLTESNNENKSSQAIIWITAEVFTGYVISHFAFYWNAQVTLYSESLRINTDCKYEIWTCITCPWEADHNSTLID